MEDIKKLFILLELFMQQPEEERQQKSWNMFHSLFIIFPVDTMLEMVDNLAAYSQQREDIPEHEKLILMAFCKYLKVVLQMLYEEVNIRLTITDISGNLFTE